MRRETERGRPRLRRALRTLRQVFGVPDYEAYLDHCREAGHPPRFTEEEYVKEFLEAKGQRVRCC